MEERKIILWLKQRMCLSLWLLPIAGIQIGLKVKSGTWGLWGLLVMVEQLDLILEAFSNLNYPLILWHLRELHPGVLSQRCPWFIWRLMPLLSSPSNVVQLRKGTKCRTRIKLCKPDGCFGGDALQKIITLKCWKRKEHFFQAFQT